MIETQDLLRIKLDGRILVPVVNSINGLVSAKTRFHFWQDGDNFYADYSGGDVRDGHIIGRFTAPRTGEMLYHCMTRDGDLKAGKAMATFIVSDDNRVGMNLDWQWISGGSDSGQSQYVEIDDRPEPL